MAAAVEELQQKDDLCGPFNAARVLRELGIAGWDEDRIAVRAGSLLPDREDGSVPPGAEPKTDYAAELPRVEPALSGTSAQCLAEAIEEAGLHAVPIRGEWTAERVVALMDLDAKLLANVRTGPFWGTHPPADALLAELRGEEVDGPESDWDVGHYVELELLVRGPAGSLIVVRDSYPSFGREGRHVQPPRAVAAALLRGDGREGGVLAVTRDAAAAETAARAADLEIGFWDNGTRREATWQ